MITTLVAAAALLTSQQPWAVDYGASRCRLSRKYGEGQEAVELTMTDVLGDPNLITLTLAAVDNARRARENGAATISLSPSGVAQHPSFFSTVPDGSNNRVVQTTIAVQPEAPLTSVSALHVKAGSIDVAVAPGVTAKALKAFTACTDELLSRLALSGHEASQLSEPAIGPAQPQDWISTDDYPRPAFVDRKEGTVVAVLKVEASGRVADCRPAVSSGDAALDTTTCTLLIRRGRFRPALGKDSRPITSHYIWQTDWRLPGAGS